MQTLVDTIDSIQPQLCLLQYYPGDFVPYHSHCRSTLATKRKTSANAWAAPGDFFIIVPRRLEFEPPALV